jgi:hypothetical protein
MHAGCSRQSDYRAMVLLSAHLYVVGMVRILLIFALVMTISLKHFERAPAYVSATTDSFSELTLAAEVSAVIVKAPDCDDKHGVAGNPLQSHKSECKAVIGNAVGSSSAAVDDHLIVQDTSTVSTVRPVDLPPPIA